MQPGLHLHLSNRMEKLTEELAAVVAKDDRPVLAPEIVVVQSAGMSRWLTQELATRLGICANVEFPFPQTLIGRIFDAALPGQSQSEAFGREPLAWRIMRHLDELQSDPVFRPVRHYLEGEQAALKRYQLARQIAHVFDRYLAHRPEMIRDWDKGGEPDDWQAKLWRSLVRELGAGHQPGLGHRLASLLESETPLPAGLPVRVSIFGVNTLPPFYIELFQALAGRIEVHFFLLQPTPAYWSDLISSRQEARLKRKHSAATAALHFERGNELLTSFGKLGQQFLDAVADLSPTSISEKFETPDPTTRLSLLQRDFLTLDPGETTAAPAECNSIRIASCHNPMREVEVLHDELLARFAADATLRPRDILVMTPDIEAYAPVIEAVFGAPESEASAIPYSVADRAPRATAGSIDAFHRLLELAGTRLGATAVMELLEAPALRARFGLAEGDLPGLRDWLLATGIRWGIDGAHRARLGLPAFEQNSWRQGLDRLLLGYALPGGNRRMFAGLLPFDQVEGGAAETLGRLLEFIDQLFGTLAELETARSLPDWQSLLLALLDRFFRSDDETARDLLLLRRAIEGLGRLSRLSGFEEAVPLEIVREQLAATLDDGSAGAGYLAGRVTFCALKPMRSIPFRFIALLGMDATAFPRRQSTPGFDRMTQKPRPGDRSSRDDDRYLFLETLLSARDALYLSYVGQSMRETAELPPSVLVSELIDYGARRFTGGLRVTKHRLQAFNAAYFEGGPLFSFSGENARAALAVAQERQAPLPFVSQDLPEPEPEWRNIDLDHFVRFFRHPARFFVEKRLGLRLPSEEPQLEDEEPFGVDSRAGWGIKEEMIAHLLEGGDEEEIRQRLLARGVLPAGHGAQLEFRRLHQAARRIEELIVVHALGDPLPPQPVDLVFGAWRLTGTLSGRRSNGLLDYRAAKFRGRDLLTLWVRLLVANETAPGSGVLITDDTVRIFPSVADGRARLEELIALYQRGLRAPLPLFPDTSLALMEGKDARKVWEKEFGEAGDEFVRLAFRDREALDDEWQEVSRRVFGPIVAAGEVVS